MVVAARILLLYPLWVVKGDQKGWSEGMRGPSVFSPVKIHDAEGEGRVMFPQTLNAMSW